MSARDRTIAYSASNRLIFLRKNSAHTFERSFFNSILRLCNDPAPSGPLPVRVATLGLGEVLFCHATPRTRTRTMILRLRLSLPPAETKMLELFTRAE